MFAKQLPRLPAGTVRWVVGDAEQLPFGSSCFDRVLLSLVLHQLADPRGAVAEAGGSFVTVVGCSSERSRQETSLMGSPALSPQDGLSRCGSAPSGRGDQRLVRASRVWQCRD